MIRPRLLAVIVCWFALWTSSGFAESISGRVAKVRDGDSFALTAGNRSFEIRVFGIDSPERDQPFGEQARKIMTDLIFRQKVRIVVRDQDDYGRIVGEVRLSDGRDLGRMMVEQGFAWWFRRYAPDRSDLEALELAARANRLGLWSQNDPIPPWLWRRKSHESNHAKSGFILNMPASANPAAGYRVSEQTGKTE